MIKIKGIDHINMLVKDLDQSKRFYKDFFNMDILEKGKSEMSGKEYIIVGIPNVISLCLYETENFKDKDQMIGHIGININNFDETYSYLKENKVELLYGGKTDWDNSSSVYIKDPSGHEIELTKNFGGGF